VGRVYRVRFAVAWIGELISGSYRCIEEKYDYFLAKL
jgi:hypothetical protein